MDGTMTSIMYNFKWKKEDSMCDNRAENIQGNGCNNDLCKITN